MPDIQSTIDKHLTRARELRHRLHRIPELAFDEHQTAKLIRGELQQLGIGFVVGPADAPTATVAVLGDVSKPCIALRADIDALPIEEKTGLPYASAIPGKMHACGHDGHAANLLLTAAVVNELAKDLPVCVKCIWQPAEEGGGGADRLVKAGVLDGRFAGPEVKAIFGLHGWPGMKVGTASSRPGALLASTDTFIARFVGRGAHGAYPHLGCDPILMAAQFVTLVQQVVSRNTDPADGVVVSCGKMNGGVAVNVIPQEAVVEGTMRTLTPETRAATVEAVRRVALGVAAAAGGEVQFTHNVGYPATINTSEMVNRVLCASEKAGLSYVPAGKPSMGGEDFAYYLLKKPGCFFLVGMEAEDQVDAPGLHTPLYDFNDDALPGATRLFVELLRMF